jgi:hypothetical protein
MGECQDLGGVRLGLSGVTIAKFTLQNGKKLQSW